MPQRGNKKVLKAARNLRPHLHPTEPSEMSRKTKTLVSDIAAKQQSCMTNVCCIHPRRAWRWTSEVLRVSPGHLAYQQM